MMLMGEMPGKSGGYQHLRSVGDDSFARGMRRCPVCWLFFRRSRWKRRAMSLAMGPVVMMAMVLIGGAEISDADQGGDAEISAPRLPLTWRVSREMMKSMPPL